MIKCKICETEFEQSSKKDRYCSDKCRQVRARQYAKKYRETYADQIKEYRRNWLAKPENRERLKANFQKYLSKNVEKHRAYMRDYYQNNKDKFGIKQ